MSYGVPPDPPPDDEVHVEGPGEFVPGVIKVGDFPPEAGPMFPGDDLPGYEPTGFFVDIYDYIEKSGLVAASGIEIQAIKNSTDIVRSSTHVALAEQIEAKRARLIYRDDGSSNNLYKVRLIGDAIVRNTVEKTRAEIVAGTNKIRDIDTKFIYNSTNARAYCTQEHDRLKYGDFSYSWSSPDDVAVGSRVALQMTSPYPTINTLVQVKSKTKTKDRPLYHYSGVGVAEFNLATVFRSGDLHFSQTQMNFFLDQVVRGNIVTIAASDYYYPANRRCDGTADEVEINAAIDKLDSESSGGTVVLSPGTFYLNAAITPTDKIVITGAGAKTVLDVSSDITGIDIVSGEDNVMIKNLTIQYSGGSEIEKYLIDSEGNNTQVIGCDVNHPGSLGVYIAGTRCKLIENDFTGGKESINITPYDEYAFNEATTYTPSISMIDDTHFVVAYRDNGNSDKGTAIIGTIAADKSITYGSEYVFNEAATYGTSVSVLDSTHFVVAYNNDGVNWNGAAIVGTVSNDDEIAYGSEYVFNAAITYNISASMLDSTHFVVAYRDASNSNHGTAIIGVVSNDDEIAYGSEYVFNSATTYDTVVSMLDSTHFVVAYRDNGNSDYGTAIIGTISNDDEIAYGSEYVFNSATTYDTSISMLDDTHFVVAYRDNGNSDYGTAIVGVVSDGDEIAYGSEVVFNEATTRYTSVSMLDSTHFIIVYRDNGNSNYGTAIIGTVVGKDYVYFTPEFVYTESTADYNSADGNIVAYYGTSNYGYARYLEFGYASYCIKSNGNNNIIGNNTIHGSTGKFIEVGIDSDGDLNTIANNTIEGDGQNREYILHGINIRDDSHNNNVSSNNISGVEKVAVVMQGTNNKVSNIMAKDNGNLIDRGDCESETAPIIEGYTTPNNQNVDTYERSSAQKYAGTYSWKATGDGGGSMYVRLDEVGSGMTGLVAGLTYKIMAYLYVPSGGYTVGNVKLFFYDSVTGYTYSSAVSAADTWELLEVEATVDDSATSVYAGCYVDETGTDSVYWDHIRLEPVGTNNEHEQSFVDYGSGTQQSSNSWQGGV